MNISEIYKKLPEPIQRSKKIYFLSRKLAKSFRGGKDISGVEPNLILKPSDMTPTGTLKNLQLLYVELLKFIDNVCKKHDLEYCLIYGTLLGAVRHKGFIPWDDDCDILMIREDYNKLIEILPKEIEKYDFFKENCGLTWLINSKDNFFTNFHDIYDKELGHEKFFDQPGLGKSSFLQLGWLKPMLKLDIFPFDYIKSESVEYYKKNYLNNKLYFRNLYYLENFSYEKEFNKLFKEFGFSYTPTEYIAEGIDASFSDYFPPVNKNLIFPTTTKEFEGYSFKCPNQSEKLLEMWYGDYMEIPKEAFIHKYVEHNETLFKSEKEMNDRFDEVITYLKEINDNFE